jgi:hypothetical protein
MSAQLSTRETKELDLGGVDVPMIDASWPCGRPDGRVAGEDSQLDSPLTYLSVEFIVFLPKSIEMGNRDALSPL